jgi:hypothetical protein
MSPPVAWAIIIAAAAACEPLGGQDPLAVFLPPGVRASVPLEDLLRGGPAVDGIPALVNPRKVSAKQAVGRLSPHDIVLGVALHGEAAAYPIRILNWHEIVNDAVGGIPVAVTYCPLCRSGIVFGRRQGGKTVKFGVSGLLYKSALVMYDSETKSLWSQILGQAIAGPSTGQALKRIAAVHTTWKEWRQKYPDTQVVDFNTGHARDYAADPYAGYESTEDLYFPVGRLDPRLHPKEQVFGVRSGNDALAVPRKLVQARGKVMGRLGKREIIFKYEDGVRAFLKDGSEIPGVIAYWFAWYAFHPKTRLAQ